MICTNFIFDNESLSDYGMIVCTFGDNNETSWSGGDITFNTQKAPSNDVHTFYTSSAETPLSCTFDICKNPCLMNKDGIEYVTQDEYSALSRFLKRRDGFHWMQFDNEGFEDIYFNAKFDMQPKEICGRTVGFTLTMTTDSPYGYSRLVTKSFELSATSPTKSFINYDDVVGISYPILKIKPKSDGNLILTTGCSDEERTTVINNVKTNSEILLDGNNDYYEGINNPNDFNYEFPIISNTYKNRKTNVGIQTTGNVSVGCSVYFEYRYKRMVTV